MQVTSGGSVERTCPTMPSSMDFQEKFQLQALPAPTAAATVHVRVQPYSKIEEEDDLLMDCLAGGYLPAIEWAAQGFML